MNKKIYASFLALAILLAAVSLIGSQAARTATAAAPAASSTLAALPASDTIVFIDMKRLLSDTLPAYLASNPALLAKVNTQLDQFREKNKFDLRAINSIAIGLRFASPSADKFNFVVVGEGNFVASELIAAGLKREAASQEQQYGGKTIYVVTPSKSGNTYQSRPRRRPQAAGKPHHQQNNPPVETKRKEADTLAVTALNDNTIALGDLESVRAAIDASAGRGRVDEELVTLATQTVNAVVAFSGKMPPSVAQQISRDNNPGVKLLAAIQKFYGSISTIGTDLDSLLTLQTENATQAHDISQVINAFKILGDNQSIALPSTGVVVSSSALLKNLTITPQDNKVEIKLKLTQADIAPFMGALK